MANKGDRNILSTRVGEKGGKPSTEGFRAIPSIDLEGNAVAATQGGDSVLEEGGEAGDNGFPDGGVEVVGITEITTDRPPVTPKEPAHPRSIKWGMHFDEELGHEGGVLGGYRKDAEPADGLGATDFSPGNLTLPARARLFAGPEEGTPSLVDSLDHASRKGASTHSVGDHGGEDGVDKNEVPPPARKVAITFGYDGAKVRESKLERGEGEAQVGLGKEETAEPKATAMEAASWGSVLIGTKVLL